MDEYDLCIIGAGMIGSCAAHHASKLLPPNSKLCLIGPEEPKDRTSDPNRSIFGAFYDEGRITSSTASDWVRAALAKRSIQNYHQIEQESGIQFYTKVASLHVLDKPEAITRAKKTITILHKDTSITTWKDLKDKPDLNYFNFEDEHTCVFDYEDAGYVNPRQIVAAYQKIAKKRGCKIICEIVNSISRNNNGDKKWVVLTDKANLIFAKKILIATGAFTAFRNVLPNGIKANIPLKSQTVLFAKVNQRDVHAFRKMPVLSVRTDATVTDCYMLPPIRYPDGYYYIKIGHGYQFEIDITTEDAIREWYKGTAPDEHKQGLWNILHTILPDFKPVSLHTDVCVTTRTPSRRPFIDLLQPTLGVALGGNGYAAMSCDEIGRLAANLIIKEKWTDPEFKQSDFMFVASAKL